MGESFAKGGGYAVDVRFDVVGNVVGEVFELTGHRVEDVKKCLVVGGHDDKYMELRYSVSVSA